MNMRDGSLICIGKGNEDWNYSAPHGAGRIMSRGEAKRNVSMEDYRKSMEGIFSTSISESTIDESPMAYKPAKEIESLIGDTVEVKYHLKPVYNFKAGSEENWSR
jgi:RNA-splicing ligase RtcB